MDNMKYYMCKTDFEYELGFASGGNRVFSSIEDLKEYLPCWEDCSIVEVEVNYVKTVVEENL